MMQPPFEPRWEDQIQNTARTFLYPPTPDIASAVQTRLAVVTAAPTRWHLRLAWAILVTLAILLTGLFAVPPVRAALLEWLQIGAVRIWLVEPTPTSPTLTQTPAPTATPLASLFDLAGATTLDEAQAKAGFPVRLPTYPADLGAPDGVFFQELGGPVVVLVWLDATQSAQARLSLQILGPGAFAEKGNVQRIAQTTVNGQPAFWTEGPYMLAYRAGSATDWDMRRVVDGHVLIWHEGDLTYRLESDLPLPEVVRVAESLVAQPPPSINFTGKTTLANAQTQLDFPLRLPTAPFASSAPDHVFVQETNGRFAVLIWMEPQDPARVRLILYAIGPGVGLSKTAPAVLRRTTVHGRPAAWIEGMHYLEHAAGGWRNLRLINQDVLVWREEVAGQTLTYRLESTLSEEQAIQLAESLR